MACLTKECLDSDEYCSVTSFSGINRSLADSMTSVARDMDEIDLCAVCYSSKGSITYATHFCEECGILGRFLCETCLIYHNQFTKHTGVKSFIAAKHKLSTKTIDTTKESDTDKTKDDGVNPTKAQRLNSFQEMRMTESELMNDLRINVTEAHSKLNEALKNLSESEKRIKTSEEQLDNVIKTNKREYIKVIEKYGELYDNEWTDTFDEFEDVDGYDEKEITHHLYSTLLDINAFCEKKSAEYDSAIFISATTLQNMTSHKQSLAKIDKTNQRLLKEVKRSFAPMLVELVFQSYLKVQNLNLRPNWCLKAYINTCVEVCWLMASQDPPIVLDTTVVSGKPFDNNKFRPYTKSGKVVDYVVWPTMLLHKDGPVISKGIAQGK